MEHGNISHLYVNELSFRCSCASQDERAKMERQMPTSRNWHSRPQAYIRKYLSTKRVSERERRFDTSNTRSWHVHAFNCFSHTIVDVIGSAPTLLLLLLVLLLFATFTTFSFLFIFSVFLFAVLSGFLEIIPLRSGHNGNNRFSANELPSTTLSSPGAPSGLRTLGDTNGCGSRCHQKHHGR